MEQGLTQGGGRRARIRITVATGILALIASACGDDGGSTPSPTEPTDPSDPGAAANHVPSDAGFETSLEAIITAAENEPPLHECNSFDDDEWDDFYGPFRERFPDIAEFTTSECGGIPTRERIFAEWSTGRYDVDVVALADDQMLQFLEADMGAQPDWSVFDGTELEFERDDRLHPSGRIYGLGATTRTMIYNPELISYDELPDDLRGCADPQYHGQMMMDIRPAGSFAMFIPLYGEDATREWAQGIVNNEPLWVRGSSPTTTSLLAGERAFVCALQLHAPFRVPGIVFEPGGIFPEGQALHAKPGADNAHSSARFANMIAEYPQAPNTALLWSAWILSGNAQFSNPGHDDPRVEGTWKQQWYENAGLEVLDFPEGRWASPEYVTRETNLIVDVWGDITPDRSE